MAHSTYLRAVISSPQTGRAPLNPENTSFAPFSSETCIHQASHACTFHHLMTQFSLLPCYPHELTMPFPPPHPCCSIRYGAHSTLLCLGLVSQSISVFSSLIKQNKSPHQQHHNSTDKGSGTFPQFRSKKKNQIKIRFLVCHCSSLRASLRSHWRNVI